MSEQHISIRTYVVVYIILMVLLLVTVGVAQIDLGVLNLTVAMVVATIKGMLVLLYFMHVRFGSPLLRIFVAASFVWLLILMGLTMSDYMTRGWALS